MENYFLINSAFEQAAWQGFFELVALSLVAYFVHVLFAKRSNRLRKRQEIIDELDTFVSHLWKPRKLYSSLQEKKLNFLISLDPSQQKLKTFEIQYEILNDLLESIGQFRSVQIKLIHFYGFHIELLAHFTAIWLYLKEVRQRIESNETLYFGAPRKENTGKPRIGSDDLYALIDHFRLLISQSRCSEQTHTQLLPPPELSETIKKRSEEIYKNFFGDPNLTPLKEAFFQEVQTYNTGTPPPSSSL
jgi:hypothetical protein